MTRRALADKWRLRPWEIEDDGCTWVPWYEIMLELDIQRIEHEVQEWRRVSGR